MWTHNLSPTILNLGPIEIRWYGIMYVLAFFITYYYARNRIRQGKLNITEKQLDDLLGNMIIYMIIGARLFYAIFYNPQYFLNAPWKILFVWEGGLSFHGGFLGITLAVWQFCKKTKTQFLKLADTLSVPIALGNALGRIGNFINAELYGKITDLPWAIIFPGAEGPRHPTQLYEAGYNILIFAILYYNRNRWKPGKLFGLFMILYAIFRFTVEFIKDIPIYGPLTMGQWLTIPVFLLGIWLIRRNN